MNELKIAFVTPEAVPFAKTGGLADVSGVLPSLFAQRGHTVKLILPFHRCIKDNYPNAERLDVHLNAVVGSKQFDGSLYRLHDRATGLEVYFIENGSFFDRSELYRDPVTGNDYEDNADRFIFFSQAVLDVFRRLDWAPDIVHVNDWQSALVSSFLKTTAGQESLFQKTKTVLTIHNMAYQGQFPMETGLKLGVDPTLLRAPGPFEYWGKINFLKSAILLSDKITTVSPSYAREIQESNEFGMGLEGVLKDRCDDLVGIINGVDYSVWSPQKDTDIPYKYIPANLSGKKRNKLELLHLAGLPLRVDQPLFGLIGRLDNQKGLDLIASIIDEMMSLDLQMIVLGTGAEEYHMLFAQTEQRYPDRFKAFLKFDNKLAHLIEAGADVFLMPSRFEPCGLNQMYSLKYGTVPIVRKTGGLADTVVDFNEVTLEGTGFVFDEYDSGPLLDAIKRAVRLYARRKTWHKLVKQGMQKDFSWDNSARQYLELYHAIVHPTT
ncbi:MAG: glycogen synthase GlgA [candidate division Zixibacteria bacterium]|nr:glycogen synthase GlgA [candidate division Zixibacteria bacterium]